MKKSNKHKLNNQDTLNQLLYDCYSYNHTHNDDCNCQPDDCHCNCSNKTNDDCNCSNKTNDDTNNQLFNTKQYVQNNHNIDQCCICAKYSSLKYGICFECTDALNIIQTNNSYNQNLMNNVEISAQSIDKLRKLIKNGWNWKFKL